MKHISALLAMLIGASSALAIDLERVGPKKPAKTSKATGLDAPVPERVEGKGDAGDVSGPALKGIVIVKSRDEVKKSGDVSAQGVKIGAGEQLDILRGEDFGYLIETFIGEPVTESVIKNIQREIILYYRSQGRSVVDVVIPEQTSIGGGVLQIFVLEGVLGRVSVEGNRWTSADFVSENVRLDAGAPINSEDLLADLDWINRNPGRRVSAGLRPGEAVGSSDVVLTVDERREYRVFMGIENTGPRFTGSERFFVGGNWYDAFGLDHRMSYQFTSDVELQFLKAHAASYEVPLPWRHTVSVYGGFADAESDFPGPIVAGQDATSWQVSLRYNVPLPKIRQYRHDFSLGFDFKQFNNDVVFLGIPTVPTDINIAQFAAQYRGSLADRYGSTSLGLSGFYSPGDLLGSNNDNASFSRGRGGSRADYIYGTASLERATKLWFESKWVVRGSGQLTTRNLQASEQMSVGGYATVRGYDEREANGDLGYVVSNEIHSPAFSPGKYLDPDASDRAVLLAFFDHGFVTEHHHHATQDGSHAGLMHSVGVGLRYSIAQNFMVRFDYGWQLRNSGIVSGIVGQRLNRSRGHISATLSF